MRRGLALFLSVVMLFSFIPYKVEGKSYVKDIDVLFGGFQLKVDNKKIVNHKEPFIYGDDLYVSLSDLSRGLGVEVNVNGNTVNLSSKGKLSFNHNSSNESIVFQRGYEIMAKERILESLEDEIYLLNNLTPGRIDYKMKANVKNIKVGFGTVSIYLDGKKLNLDTEPLKYNNDIYLSLDSIAPYLYITPSMSKDKVTINIDANGILVKSNTYSTISALLSMREGRNYLLDLQRDELEKKKSFMNESKLPYEKIKSIKSLENYLSKNLNKVGELEVKFDVVKQSNWINLDISFPNSKDYLWYRLKRSDVEQWIWKIYATISDLYDSEALISGVIRNPYYLYYSNYNLNNYVSFYAKDKDIYFDFSKSKLDIDHRINPSYLIEHLNANLSRYYLIDLVYEARMSGENLELIVYPSSNEFSKLSLYTKMGYLKSLNQRIKLLYPDLVIDGKIVYPDKKIELLDFYINENRIRSLSLMEETMKSTNDYFGIFGYGNHTYRLNYSIYERDLKNFQLFVKADLSVNDANWINAGEAGIQKLNANIHNALSYIVSLWDANISAEVVDKNGVLISEVDIFQEDVSVVYATPTSGEVLEGTRVYLYTATPGANIYYTIDGSTPTIYTNPYDGTGIEVTKNMDINAFGYKDGFGSGPVSTFRYTVVKDEGLSDGLNGLAISPGTLTPGFSQNNHNYTVTVDTSLNTINITPSALKGAITINGSSITSGQVRSITLINGANTITIKVKEDNKRERVYTVVVVKDNNGNISTFDVADLRFNTLVGLIFNGRITSNNINDFNGYKVEIFTKSGLSKGSFITSSSGEFSIKNQNIDWSDKISGFKYKVYDNTGTVVLERNLD